MFAWHAFEALIFQASKFVIDTKSAAPSQVNTVFAAPLTVFMRDMVKLLGGAGEDGKICRAKDSAAEIILEGLILPSARNFAILFFTTPEISPLHK